MDGTDRVIDEGTLARMVANVDGEWRVESARLADSGFLPVYHMTVATPDGSRQMVLKAAPPGESPGVALESRLLRGIRAKTDIPVPAVYGAVDVHDDLPAPYFLMSELPGESVARDEMDRLSDEQFRRVARQVGGHLAALHAVDAVDAFGFLTVDAPSPLRGGRPDPGFETVAVVDPEPDWPTRLQEWAEDACDRLADTRFDDLAAAVRPALLERASQVDGQVRPALGHVDGAVENLLLDDDRRVVGLLDWAFTLAVPPAYDLAFVEHSLAGGLWERVPSAPAVRTPVRTGLLEGYREAGERDVVGRFRRHRDCYELYARVNGLVVFEEWFGDRDLDAATVDAAAANHRRAVRELL